MTLALVQHLDRQLFDIDVAVFTQRSELSREYEQLRINVLELMAHKNPVAAAGSLFKLLRNRKYHIIHVYGFKVSLATRVISRLASPETVVLDGIRNLSVGASWEKGDLKSEFSLIVGRLFSRFVDYHVTNSETAKRFLTTYGRLRPEKFVVIPNGVSASYWNSDVRARIPKRIACVALFRPAKRQQDLVAALNQLSAEGIDFECVFAGDGPNRADVEHLVKKLGLATRVRFLGHLDRENVRDLLSTCGVFVLPSVAEGLPGSVMEAMANGLPVVATDVGGTAELVVHDETGFLVPARRPDLLATFIKKLLADHQMRLQMGEAGRRRINEQFSLQSMVDRTADLYATVALTPKRESL